MTDRPVADREPLSAEELSTYRRWAEESIERSGYSIKVEPRLLLSLLDTARAHPDEAGLLREAIAEMAPVHVGQMYAATDHGDVQYRPDDCLYRGDVLALLLAQPAVPVAGAEEGLTGRAVHAAWRDGMLAQGRDVAPERMSWDTLSIEDRLLDDGIAAALCPDEFGVNRLAKALVDSGLMQRYSDYANSLPTMRHGTPEELARDWAPTIRAALAAARAHPDEAGLLREALERIARSTREEGGRCVWCGNASLATYHHDYCPKEIARVALDLWPAVPVAGAEVPCARYWGSDGTLCSTHNGRFASDAAARCVRAAQPEDDGLDVERLAKAINEVTAPADPSESTLAWDLDFGREWYGTPRELATEIAAALRESSEGVERRDGA